ncbi:hypothetical protein V1509DRAFT_614482 [Lipomyces kononenkoae]
MSSADIRDMLDLPSQVPAASRPPPAKRIKTDGKKLDGIHRELHNLLGENTPPVTVMQSKFKEKPNWMQKPSPWVWTKFKNPARGDDLELYHWVRGAPSNDEYPFAKFNKPVDVPTFSKEEYDKCLADTAWTSRETEYLFDLCREYDLRWLVVQDRYDYEPEENEPPSIRTLEDLKERYYFCCRKLMELRRDASGADWTPRDLELYNAMNFNKDKEIMRKQYLERLLSRSPAEIAEEERLILEYRRLQESSKKLVQDREELLRLLESPQTANTFAQYQSPQGLSQLAGNILASDKNRRRKGAPEAAAQGGQVARAVPGTPNGGAPPQAVTPQQAVQNGVHGTKQTPQPGRSAAAQAAATPAVSKAELAQSVTNKKVAKRVPPGQENLYGISYHDKLVQGVYLRSTKISTLKPTVQTKVASILAELGIAPKLAMPTAKVCDRYEALQQAINLLIETKKQVDKLDHEVKVSTSGNAVQESDA